MIIRNYYWLAVALVGTVSAHAASASAAPVQPTLTVPNSITADQIRSAINSSRAYLKAGDFVNGEAALFSTNQWPDGTVGSYRESASALVRMAWIFRQNGDGVTASKLAQDALAQLAQAQSSAANDKKVLAEIYTFTGYVQEQLRGTRQQAESSYRTAISLSPSTTRAAVAALRRLQEGDATIAQRAAKKKGD